VAVTWIDQLMELHQLVMLSRVKLQQQTALVSSRYTRHITAKAVENVN